VSADQVPVLTALVDASEEAALAAAWAGPARPLRISRRCVDTADLLAAATTGQAVAAVVSAGLPRFDLAVVAQLAEQGVAVVGLCADEAEERRLRMWGAAAVLAPGEGPDAIAEAVLRAAGRRPSPARPRSADRPGDGGPAGSTGGGLSDHRPSRVAPPTAADALDPPVAHTPDRAATGRVVAVWGPAGSPGRTTAAIAVATAWTRSGLRVLLVDADPYAASVALALGIADEIPGLAAACRAAHAGGFDQLALARSACAVEERLLLLSGLPRPERWAEVDPVALDHVLARSRALVDVVVVDCGFGLDGEAGDPYGGLPGRDDATLAALAAADAVLAVCGADPVSVTRLVRSWDALRAAAPDATIAIVANRLRRSAVGGSPEATLTDALDRWIGAAPWGCVPDDPDAFDAAVLTGRPVCDAAPRSRAAAAWTRLAEGLGEALALPGYEAAAAGSTRRRLPRGARRGTRRRAS